MAVSRNRLGKSRRLGNPFLLAEQHERRSFCFQVRPHASLRSASPLKNEEGRLTFLQQLCSVPARGFGLGAVPSKGDLRVPHNNLHPDMP